MKAALLIIGGILVLAGIFLAVVLLLVSHAYGKGEEWREKNGDPGD